MSKHGHRRKAGRSACGDARPSAIIAAKQAVEILAGKAFALTVERLCHQLIEDHDDLAGTALIGLQPRGVLLARRLRSELRRILGREALLYGELDITFHRDDFRHRATPPAPSATQLDFSLEGRQVVLVDDVLFTGRTIRAGLDAMLAFGRPAGVRLLVLIDRRFSRELPVQPKPPQGLRAREALRSDGGTLRLENIWPGSKPSQGLTKWTLRSSAAIHLVENRLMRGA